MVELDINKVIETNRRVRRGDFDAADRLSKEMEEEGAKPSTYRIDGPGAGKRVSFGERDESDSRALRLTRSK